MGECYTFLFQEKRNINNGLLPLENHPNIFLLFESDAFRKWLSHLS